MSPRIVRHRKLSAEALAAFEHEADLIVAQKSYDELATLSGLTLGSVQQIMAQLIRERRHKVEVVHRGTQSLELQIADISAKISRPSEDSCENSRSLP